MAADPVDRRAPAADRSRDVDGGACGNRRGRACADCRMAVAADVHRRNGANELITNAFQLYPLACRPRQAPSCGFRSTTMATFDALFGGWPSKGCRVRVTFGGTGMPAPTTERRRGRRSAVPVSSSACARSGTKAATASRQSRWRTNIHHRRGLMNGRRRAMATGHRVWIIRRVLIATGVSAHRLIDWLKAAIELAGVAVAEVRWRRKSAGR